MAGRRTIIAVIGVLVVVTIVALLASRPGDARLTVAPVFDVTSASEATPAPGEPGSTVARVVYRDGGLLRYVFALHNGGPEALTVTEVVAPPPSAEVLLRPVAMGLARAGIVLPYSVGVSSGDLLNADASMPDSGPFHAFTLAPGEERAVYVWARMGDCEFYQPGSAQTFEAVTVRYSVRGDARETSLTLPMSIRVEVPLDVRCPRQWPDAGSHGPAVQVPPPVPVAPTP